MPAFLRTTENNPQYDWLLVTDDETPYRYPANVHVQYCTLSDLADRAQKKYDFPISLTTPRKLCGFKPAYGHIFQDELRNYEFWGYCDLDEYFGDLETFIPAEVLRQYDKLFTHGHMTMYRNDERMRLLYQTECDTQPPEWRSYRYIFSTPELKSFDEMDMTQIAKRGGVRNCYSWWKADVHPFRSLLWGAIWQPEVDSSVMGLDPMHKFLLYWENGHMYMYGKESGVFERREILYVHLQKRKLKLHHFDSNCERFVIYPNRITSLSKETDPERALQRIYKRTIFRSVFKIDETRKRVHDFWALWTSRFRRYILHKG